MTVFKKDWNRRWSGAEKRNNNTTVNIHRYASWPGRSSWAVVPSTRGQVGRRGAEPRWWSRTSNPPGRASPPGPTAAGRRRRTRPPPYRLPSSPEKQECSMTVRRTRPPPYRPPSSPDKQECSVTVRRTRPPPYRPPSSPDKQVFVSQFNCKLKAKSIKYQGKENIYGPVGSWQINDPSINPHVLLVYRHYSIT